MTRYFDYLIALLQRLREHFPLTIQGVLSLAVTLLALRVFGYGAMDLVVFALSICAIAILLFSLFCVIFGGLLQQLRVRRQILDAQGSSRRVQLEAGYPNETGFSLPDLGYFPLIRLSWKVVYPDHLQTRLRLDPESNRLVEEIIPGRRCRAGRITRLFTVSDVLGFCRYSWRQSQTLDLLALPRCNSIKTLPILRSLTSEDGIPSPSGNPEGDRMEIRPYVAGDSIRNIMWKSYARNRQLNVRLAEKSVFQSNRTIAYLLSGPNDEAAAAVARVALESGALGDNWTFGADGTELPCDDLESALVAVAASRALDEPFAYGLDSFLRRTSGQTGCHCIVFATAETGPWISSLRQTLSRFRGQFSLVLATDGFNEPGDAGFWTRLLFREFQADEMTDSPGGARATTGRRELGQLLTEISQSVESTLVVDRTTGASFDRSLRKI
ncbi:MAG: DUF58 domain-containing protein [Gammaproteobacteria bacterium]|nr:DUF58 domain-containing protein [Pseudomonadales bacterium]MCP5345495.1 DUF58 domain-containing protein [Pseudomonadales bacterium]